MKKIKVGTRKSALAMWQTHHVCATLNAHGIETEIKQIVTKGDKILDVTISKIGSKGVFTEEIEEQLKSGEIDIAVHSAKDMASQLPSGFELIAYGEREAANDVFVGTKPLDIKTLRNPKNEIVIGTSSTRRIALLHKYFPGTIDKPIRGNLQKRIAKLEEGQCDYLLLAKAGVLRQDFSHFIQHELSTDSWCPPAGQGSVTIECYKGLEEKVKLKIKDAFNDEDTALCVLAERSFLKVFNGGCSIPIFVHARLIENEFRMHGGIISLEGESLVQCAERTTDLTATAVEKLGAMMAEDVLKSGGDRILKKIKNQLKL